MGNSGAKLKTSSDWTANEDDKEEPPKETVYKAVGTDYTYTENDLLKSTNSTVLYEPTPKITKEDIPVSGAFLVHNLLTPSECEQYIKISEEMGYSQAPLRNLDTLNSTNFTLTDDTKTIRNSQRVLFDVPDPIGKVINERLLPFLPEIVQCEGKTWKVCKEEPINRRWRFNRYNKGNYFKPHFDAGFVYGPTKKTLFTFIVYLNEGCEGGETIFFPGNKRYQWSQPEPGIECRVVPKTGMALIFFQAGELNHRHEGAEVLSESPKKYILRSDLAYELVTESNNNNASK